MRLPLHVVLHKCVCRLRSSLCVLVGLKTSACTLVHAELGISLGANVAPVCCIATVCASHALPTGQRFAWTRVKFNSLCSSTYLDLVLSCQRCSVLLNAHKKVQNFLFTKVITFTNFKVITFTLLIFYIFSNIN